MPKKLFDSMILFLCIFVVLFISGCSSRLKLIDDKIGDIFNDFQKNQQKDLIDTINNKKNIESSEYKKSEYKKDAINNKQKELINKWLEDNNFNRYGDSKDILYTGGTPLFNESTRESIDRFDYIFKKHPNLLDELK